MYPENWQLTEDREEQQVVGFTLQSPNTAFLVVIAYPWTMPPKDALEQARMAIESEYDEVEFEPTEPSLDLMVGPLMDWRSGEMRFYYLDLLVVCRLVAFSASNQTYLVQCQAEDREFESLEMVFEAMLASMIRSTRNLESGDNHLQAGGESNPPEW
jgi:hypothetical protein